MKILFVEDDSNTYEVFAMFFKLEGHQTQCARDGHEAINAVQYTVFDAIVMDVEMPFLNGIEATRQVRQWSYSNGCPHLLKTGAAKWLINTLKHKRSSPISEGGGGRLSPPHQGIRGLQ